MDFGKLAVIAVATFGLNAGQPSPRPPAPCPILDLAEPLELTQKQQDQIRQVFEAHTRNLEAKRGEARKARKALMKAMEDPDAEAGQIRTFAAKESSAHLEELLEGHAMIKETHALLTPEQREKLKKMRPERPFPGPGRPGGPGRESYGHPGFMPPPPPPPFGDMEGPFSE